MDAERIRDYGPEWQEAIDRVFDEPSGLTQGIEKNSRILVIGTNYEVRVLREKDIAAKFEGKQVDYCSIVYNFWGKFLGTQDLESPDSFSLPEKIVTTGLMRAYEYFSETANVKDHLKRIAEKYDVEVEKIPSFAL